MKNELLLLSALTLALVGLISILFLYLVTRKLAENHKRKKIEHWKSRFQAPVLSYLFDGTLLREMTVNTDEKRIAIEELLSGLADVLEDEKGNARLNAYADKHLKTYYRKQLSSRKWSRRMNAMYHIEKIRLTSLSGDLERLFLRKRSSKEERVQCLRVLALFQHKKVLDYLIEIAYLLSETEIRQIIQRYDQPLFDQAILSFHNADVKMQNVLLDVIALQKQFKYKTFVESVYELYSGELRIRALKAISELGYIEDINKYIGLAESGKWEERMLAAKLIGIFKDSDYTPCLIKLLRDNNWWVRSKAAEALMNLRGGRRVLEEVYKNDHDRFAREMAWEWLNKGV
ncbi:hypothetical protein CVD28_07495 [Bacillus sp. M6-12]|uniref:HEAT repeat domain-containing protein n=1 Tax=Bacillus sp. M6-12 TaxID=2054166 RepID=UPI000C766E65|nr:HEAT repeat domain-containing protein [Bacillus sp. M6-12]PLS18133.1 hypothetical protein CVD28_07495 [Bacillus sp. M6-12]